MAKTIRLMCYVPGHDGGSDCKQCLAAMKTKAKPKQRYINYVDYVLKISEFKDEELQDEMNFLRTKLRMCEQDLRRRRTNARVIQRTIGHDTVAPEQVGSLKRGRDF